MIPGLLLAVLAFVHSDGPHTIEVPVTAPSTVSLAIAPGLALKVERTPDVQGVVSWEVAVRKRGRPDDNLLYHSPILRGPYPTMIAAWIIRDRYFPVANDFDVRGYPWRVRVECRGCTVGGTGEHSHLTSGTIRVQWRRR